MKNMGLKVEADTDVLYTCILSNDQQGATLVAKGTHFLVSSSNTKILASFNLLICDSGHFLKSYLVRFSH